MKGLLLIMVVASGSPNSGASLVEKELPIEQCKRLERVINARDNQRVKEGSGKFGYIQAICIDMESGEAK